MPRAKNIVGDRFNRWTVISRAENWRGVAAQWLCRCDCGTERIVLGASLRSGHSTSCGCAMKELAPTRRMTHGKSKTTTYKIWSGMHDRCRNPNSRWFHCYGGKGIRVCESWSSFENFVADMGERPAGLSIERLDSSKDYSPANCVWATPKAQSRNTSRNRHVEFNGESKCVAQWAEDRGIPRKTLIARLNYGWTPGQALEFESRGAANMKHWT